MIDVWVVSRYSSRFQGFKGDYRWDRKFADQKLLEIKTNIGHEKIPVQVFIKKHL